MRDIKFRAWCKKDSMMYDVYSIEFLNGGIKVQGTGVCIGNGWATELNGFKHDCDVELMQFTGLTDKNGVDIYEGDIAERDGWIGEVYYKVVNGRYEMAEVNNGAHLIRAHKFNQMIVIGNIHENPELLNK